VGGNCGDLIKVDFDEIRRYVSGTSTSSVRSLITRVKTSGSIPPPRWCHASCLFHGHKMLIFGGWDRNDVKFFNDAYVLDFLTMEWQIVQPRGVLPSPRCQMASFIMNDHLFYVLGGAFKSAPPNAEIIDCNDVYVLDLDVMIWNKAILEIPKRGVFTATLINENNTQDKEILEEEEEKINTDNNGIILRKSLLLLGGIYVKEEKPIFSNKIYQIEIDTVRY